MLLTMTSEYLRDEDFLFPTTPYLSYYFHTQADYYI